MTSKAWAPIDGGCYSRHKNTLEGGALRTFLHPLSDGRHEFECGDHSYWQEWAAGRLIAVGTMPGSQTWPDTEILLENQRLITDWIT